MARLQRLLLPDGFFHVTSRGVRKTTIFTDDLDYGLFTALLQRVGRKANWTLHAHCLMPNHFHLVVETRVVSLVRAMHFLKGRYAESFNARYEFVGHVFESRYRTRVIEDEDYLVEACCYVWDNPVRAGLCARAGDWPWSG
jgi:REP element-mobilizing transposase RayT